MVPAAFVWYNTKKQFSFDFIIERGISMSLADDMHQMELYKTFEPYIKTKSLETRLKGQIELKEDAPKEAQKAFAEWMAHKIGKRF